MQPNIFYEHQKKKKKRIIFQFYFFVLVLLFGFRLSNSFMCLFCVVTIELFLKKKKEKKKKKSDGLQPPEILGNITMHNCLMLLNNFSMLWVFFFFFFKVYIHIDNNKLNKYNPSVCESMYLFLSILSMDLVFVLIIYLNDGFRYTKYLFNLLKKKKPRYDNNR